MKVLFTVSEVKPFIASGGLGDVAGSLPQALRKRMVGCRVVAPLYSGIKQEYKDQMKYLTNIVVPVAWRRQYCGIFELRKDGVVYYFLDNEYYFKRDTIYGHYDDAERFAFFSRAVLEIIPVIDFKPDIIHCHDWQSALIPAYYSKMYAQREGYENIKTVFTIHNIQYQGKYGLDLNKEVVGLPEQDAHILEYDGCVNFMKGAIETANKITTVSPTYANEILDPWFSHGLDPILNQRAWKLQGILNGIGYDMYNPESDKDIWFNYNAEAFSAKAKNKKDAQVVILGSGEWQYESFFSELAAKYPDRVGLKLGFFVDLAQKIYAGSDIFLMPSKSEPCGLSQMIALRYGSIPIIRETGGLRDSIFDSGDGKGNGFTFASYNAHDMLHAMRRAVEGFKDKEGWQILVKRAMECDYSWGRSAGEYIKMYKEILKG